MRRRKTGIGRIVALAALIAAVALILGGFTLHMDVSAAGAAMPSVRFNRVMSSNRDACYPINGLYYDWVELSNPGEADVSLRGWRLTDRLDLRLAYVFQDAVIPAGGTLVVYCADRPQDAPADALFTGFRLDSDGERLMLADPHERLIDALVVPALKANWVYRRDDAGEWSAHRLESQRPADDAFVDGPLRVNELMPVNHATLADSDGDYSDWIELYNAGDAAVDLDGYILTDRENKARWRFPARRLDAGEYLVVFASGKNRRDANGELHTSFSLSASDAAVHLKDAGGREISRLACDIDEADRSVCRDGNGGVTRSWPATPGYANSESGLPEAMPELSENACGLYINELMSVSGGADWVELYNASPAAQDLSGMGLSDDPAHPRRWRFPAGASIPGGGALLVALSGGDEETPGAYTADFGLSVGETLCLSLPDGTVVDRVRLYAQPPGASYGRASGEPRYRYFTQPTPGAPNAGPTYARQTAKVSFSQPGGLHDEARLSVALSSDPGAEIRYTLDGSAPTADSALYREPIELTESGVIRATATRDDALPAAASAATYILGQRHDGIYTVCVSGGQEALIGPFGALNTGFKRDDSDVFVEIYGADGERLIAQDCNLMVSGRSSRLKAGQKAFRLNARSEYGDARFRARLFSNRDYTDYKAITLRAAGQDNQETHIRDSVLSALAADTGVMYLESEVAAVYINGEYWGLYNLRERITPDAIAKFEGWDDPDDIIIVNNGEREKGDRSGYVALMEWIAQADLTSDGDMERLRQQVDVENYLDYVALEMYVCNLDLSNVRCYCNPEADGKWRWIFYDLDLSYKVDRNMARDWLIPGGVGTITRQDNTLFVKLMENADVRDAFLTRMGELLRTTFSPERVIGRFEARRALIAPEMPTNCARWDWSVDTWRGRCDKFVEYARTRPGKLAEYLAMAFQLSDDQARAYFEGV